MVERQVAVANTSAISKPKRNTAGLQEEPHSFEVIATLSEARKGFAKQKASISRRLGGIR
jgi:hypothetical protein